MKITWEEKDVQAGTMVVLAGFSEESKDAFGIIGYYHESSGPAYGMTVFSDGLFLPFGKKRQMAEYLSNMNAKPLSESEKSQVITQMMLTTKDWHVNQKRDY